MKLACQLGKGMDADLIALHVVEVAPTLPLSADSEILDRPGKEILVRAHHVAETYKISTRLVRAREAGEAIVGEARDLGAELLVLGYHRKSGFAEVLLGSNVQYVAHHAPCRVVVQILPRDGQ